MGGSRNNTTEQLRGTRTIRTDKEQQATEPAGNEQHGTTNKQMDNKNNGNKQQNNKNI
jgi:hypothetical protein